MGDTKTEPAPRPGSPLPWDQLRVGRPGNGSPRSYEAQLCNGEEDYGVCIITHDGSDEAEANIKFMQHACNSHDTLRDERDELRTALHDEAAEVKRLCAKGYERAGWVMEEVAGKLRAERDELSNSCDALNLEISQLRREMAAETRSGEHHCTIAQEAAQQVDEMRAEVERLTEERDAHMSDAIAAHQAGVEWRRERRLMRAAAQALIDTVPPCISCVNGTPATHYEVHGGLVLCKAHWLEHEAPEWPHDSVDEYECSYAPALRALMKLLKNGDNDE